MATPNNRNGNRGRSQSNTGHPRPDRPHAGSVPQNRGQQSAQQPRNQAQRPGRGQQPQRQQPHQAAQPPRNQRPHPHNQRPVQPPQTDPRRRAASQNPSVAKRARSQTPANRRAARAQRRIDPRQLEIQRRRKEAHKFYVRKQRRNAFRIFFGRFVIFLAMFAVVFASWAGIILLRYYSYEKPVSEIVYQIGADEDEDMTSRTVKRESIVINDTLYINITEIALLCEFTTTGDLDEIRLISKNESNDNVKLVLDSPVITINGNPVRLSAPVFKSGESVFVPIEFFDSYVTGITVTYDKENAKVTIVREVTGMTEAKLNKPSEPIYADICFTLKYSESTDNIPEDSLDPDIRIATEPKADADNQS
ncbi:MAG: hypothetical protein IJA85_12825 [Clostridia bacterium]|nr:hypothetical protein [Clostridia bacterium]